MTKSSPLTLLLVVARFISFCSKSHDLTWPGRVQRGAQEDLFFPVVDGRIYNLIRETIHFFDFCNIIKFIPRVGDLLGILPRVADRPLLGPLDRPLDELVVN